MHLLVSEQYIDSIMNGATLKVDCVMGRYGWKQILSANTGRKSYRSHFSTL